MSSENKPPRPADGALEMTDLMAQEPRVIYLDDERTANLTRRAKERQDWDQAHGAIQVADSQVRRKVVARLVILLEAVVDWIFGFYRWIKQRPMSKRELALLQTAQAGAHKVESLWQRFRRRLRHERVEVLRFVRDPQNLTYDLERDWTLFSEIEANSSSYGMAAIAIHRFGRVTASIRDVQLEAKGLKIRLTRRKGLTLFRLKDESGDIALLTEAVAILLLSQYEGAEALSLNQLAAKLDARSQEIVERPVYQASTELRQQISADWQALRERKLLRSGQ